MKVNTPKTKKNEDVSTSVSASASAPMGGEGAKFKVFIQGLPWKVTEKEIRSHFKSCGKCIEADLPLGTLSLSLSIYIYIYIYIYIIIY